MGGTDEHIGANAGSRSLVKTSRGVNIAEFSMRTWVCKSERESEYGLIRSKVLQPGFMITHWQHLRHAAISVLGMITLTAALISMAYTTAADSLVSPHLKYGDAEIKVMYGLVKSKYANPVYVGRLCQTPISIESDEYAASTCLAIEHAGQAYHNSLAFLTTWE